MCTQPVARLVHREVRTERIVMEFQTKTRRSIRPDRFQNPAFHWFTILLPHEQLLRFVYQRAPIQSQGQRARPFLAERDVVLELRPGASALRYRANCGNNAKPRKLTQRHRNRAHCRLAFARIHMAKAVSSKVPAARLSTACAAASSVAMKR